MDDGQTGWRALTDFRKARSLRVGRKSKFADFSDALILNKAVKCADDAGVEMSGLVTFDEALLELTGTIRP